MSWTIKPEYAAELDAQWPLIAQSVRTAQLSIVKACHPKLFGLEENDPPELWRIAFAKCERPMKPLTKAQQDEAKQSGDHIRKFDRSFTADLSYAANESALRKMGRGVGEAVDGLRRRAKNDVELTGWLSKLVALQQMPPLTREAYEQARPDADKRRRLLLKHWIQDPRREDWASASLCLYSESAIAKLVHLLSQPIASRKPLALEKQDTAAENIGKICQRLGLLSATRRLIKDIAFKSGRIHYVPFATVVQKV